MPLLCDENENHTFERLMCDAEAMAATTDVSSIFHSYAVGPMMKSLNYFDKMLLVLFIGKLMNSERIECQKSF